MQTLSNNYILKDRVTVTVQTDGVKTWKQILNTLASEFVSTARSLASDEYITPLYLYNGDFYVVCESPRLLANNINSINLQFSVVRNYSNRTSTYFYVVATTVDANGYNTSGIDSNGFTYTDNSSSVPDSGRSISIGCDVKKKL